MAEEQTPPSTTEPDPVEEREENDEQQSLESRIVIRQRTAEQVKRSIVFLFVNLEFVAGIYVYLGIRSRNLSWNTKAIQIFPMFLIPALATFLYSPFSDFAGMPNLRDIKLLPRLIKKCKSKMLKVISFMVPEMARGNSIEEISPIDQQIEDHDMIIFGDINQLPHECLSRVISLTTPRDACVSSTVSRAFRSVADSDATWQCFLPSDYASFLSQAVDPVEYASKKELYFRLCDHPVPIVGGSMSFGLNKSSGAKCFMISARSLSIIWSNDLRYWKWIALLDSRFSECAVLKAVCWLEIRGRIDSRILTPNTAYAAYLVFKLANNAQGLNYPSQATEITLAGDTVSQHLVSIWDRPLPGEETEEMIEDVRLPRKRPDRWLEVELGEFDSGDGTDGDVNMSFREISDDHWKRGLIVQGIEVKPKH